MRKNKKIISLVTLILLFLQVIIFIQPVFAEENGEEIVYIVPVEESIEQGLEKFLERAFSEAEQGYASTIILEINTPGGEIEAAADIGELILAEDIPVIAYVKNDAISAGSYISLCADKIYMNSNSSIGDAAVRTITGDEVDPKITSYWSNKMLVAARHNERNEEVIKGMVDPSVEIAGVTKNGELITLDSVTAVDLGIADGVVKSRTELLDVLGLNNADIEEIDLTPAENLARFVTNPYVASTLLILGIAGILIELFIPGFGIAGGIGLISFGLYFFGSYIAGFAGWEAIILFVIGLVFVVVEIFLAGFGVFGILGITSLILGIVLAAYDTTLGLISLLIAIAINIVLAIVLVKFFGSRGLWNRFILKEEQKNEDGYISSEKDKSLIGKRGKSITKLRPSGTAKIEGKRYDVITEGNFIDFDVEIEVVSMDGTKVVVQEIK